MADNRNTFQEIFLAGVGALAYGGERASELIDKLIEKGEITVEQGKQINSELQHKAGETFAQLRHEALEAQMMAMTPEQRAEFVAKVNDLAAQVTSDTAAAADAANAAEAEAEASAAAAAAAAAAVTAAAAE